MSAWLIPLLIATLTGALVWLFREPMRLRIGERGILDRTLRLGWIRWDEIEGAYQPSAQDLQSLHLKLRRARRSFEVRLDMTDSEVTPMQLLQEIVARNRGALTH